MRAELGPKGAGVGNGAKFGSPTLARPLRRWHTAQRLLRTLVGKGEGHDHVILAISLAALVNPEVVRHIGDLR